MTQPVELIRYIVSNIINDINSVSVQLIEGETESIIELKVNESDMSRVIGRGGSIVRSMRGLLRSCSLKDDKNYVLEIIE